MIVALLLLVLMTLVSAYVRKSDRNNNYCYTAMEYSGDAAFGCCCGKGDESCKQCKYYVDVGGNKE